MSGSPDLLVITGVRAGDPARSRAALGDLVIERGAVTRRGAGAATAELPKAEGARIIAGRGPWSGVPSGGR